MNFHHHLQWIVVVCFLVDGLRGFILPLFTAKMGGRYSDQTIPGVPAFKLTRSLPSPSSSSSDLSEYDEESESPSQSIAQRRRRQSGRIRPIRHVTASSMNLEARRNEARLRHEEALNDPTLLTNDKFADRHDMHPATKRAITEIMGLQSMTEIQSKTYEAALSGESILGRSRTGTGKTLAFLLPSLERLLAGDLSLFKGGRSIGMLIVAPTTELAIQISEQARDLLTFHADMDVMCMSGGKKMSQEVRQLSSKSLPTILVSTPGRLLDHLDGTRIQHRKFSSIMAETKIVVLDEMDRLLDGFPKEIRRILSFLPRTEKRQTLLFSATVPKRLRAFLANTMKIDCREVDCIHGNGNAETGLRLVQSYFVLDGMDQYITALVAIVRKAVSEDDNHKILVFLPAVKLVRYFATLFNVGLGIPVLEIHSRMSHSARLRASSTFKDAKRGVLFTSDVSARGIDYPDVTFVIQYGFPSTNEMYIHRLGRTGRAGKKGKGLLVLLPFEENRVHSLRRYGVEEDTKMAKLVRHSTTVDGTVHDIMESVRGRVQSGHPSLLSSAKGAYLSFLAYYIPNSCGLDSAKIQDCAKTFARGTGLVQLPLVEAKLASRLQLDDLEDDVAV